MAKSGGRSQRPVNARGRVAKGLVEVPSENVEILKEALGVDLVNQPEELKAFVSSFKTSISASPYPSADMLKEYVEAGFDDLPAKVLGTIDRQVAHRQALEVEVTRASIRRQNRAQIGALFLGITGVISALVAGYLGVTPSICIVTVIISVGGPSTATVVARLMDRVR